MSAYEWVIEQESPDGVTTRIVFDFADDDDNEGDSDGGLHRSGRGSNNNGNRYRGSSSSHHRTRGGRGGRSHSSAYGQSQTALQAQLQQQQPQQQQQQAGGVNLFYTQKDVTTRSEGGSSKRSSKRSNGSRSRRHRHHHASNGSGTSMSSSGMLTPAGSAYTSAALRQRYHRMLFGERGGSGNGSSRFDPTSNNVNTINFYTRAAAPTISNASATGYSSSPPPSTLFLSTYGAELAEEEDQSSGSYPPRRSRTSTNSSSSNTNQNNHTNSSGATNPDNATAAATAASAYPFAPSSQLSGEPGLKAPWAAYTAATALSPTTAESPVFAPSSLLPHTAAESPPVRPSLPLSDTSAHDYVDDDDRYCHYIKRDVWAARATCPRTVIASPTVFPAFPPLHPIPLEEESEWAKQQGRNAPGEAAQLGLCQVHKNMINDDDGTANELLKSAQHGPTSPVPFAVAASAQQQQQQQQFRVVSSLPDGFDQMSGGLHNAFAHRDNEAQLLQRTAAEASADEAQRYNKMLLRKERQRGRGRSRGWQTTTATAVPASSGADGYAGRGRGSGGQANAVAARRSRHHRRADCCSSSSSTPSSCASDDDADFEVDSDDESSLECLSNTSSSDTDSDAEALRADVSFSAKVQSLATRAGRERRKMEAREERQLENELARCEEALMTPPLAAVPLPDSPTSPTSPITATASSFAPPPGPATLAAALRQRDNAFTAASARAMGNGTSMSSTTSSAFTTSNTRYNTCISATGGSISSHSSSSSAGNSRTPSSFFISPIHQSVAAESASWAAGTQIQFLGQGGLGNGSGGGNNVSGATYRLGNDDRTYKPHHTRSVNVNGGGGGGGGGGYAGGLSRRRARADDDDDEERDEEARGAEGSHHAEHDAPAVAGSGAPKTETAALSKSQTRRARKLRKKGDTAQQSVVPECGGSRALRPVAPPSLEPPMELLPCSKKEMCEDMLESFLMAAVLDDGDDLKLL